MTTLYAPAEIIWSRIIANTTITATCWTWRGTVNSKGYGCVGSGKRSKTALVHRVAVIVRDGSLADDLVVDHMCGNKRCVRPDHLDVVTNAENIRRGYAHRGYHLGGHCGKGHLLTEANIYRSPRGQLVCRTCARSWRPPETQAQQVRNWAAANGYAVSRRGRLPKQVIDAYEAANPHKAAS